MSLTREDRAEARRVVERAVSAQAALDAALAAHKNATAELARAKDEQARALADYREWSRRQPFAPVVGGCVAVDADDRLALLPLHSVDDPTPQPQPQPEPAKSLPKKGASK